MTRDPVTVSPAMSVHQAAWIMVERRFGALPVVENGRTQGIVTETDLLRYFASDGMERARKSRTTNRPRRKIA
jgi:CBS domain-containing protein